MATFGAVLMGTSLAGADGTETLGEPSVAVKGGTGIAVGGTGLFSQPGTLTVDVPADATIEQALLYYEVGHTRADGAHSDDTIEVDGQTLTCGLIGGPAFFYGDVVSETRRCDITADNLVQPGANSLSVSGLDAAGINDGAGVLVIYSQPGRSATISLVDGNDIAFVDFPDDRRSTVAQTFAVPAATVERKASLAMMVASIADKTAPEFTPRPSTMVITAGSNVVTLRDPFKGQGDGAQWDSSLFEVTIPAGVDAVTVQMLSEWGGDGLPASLVWISAALAVQGDSGALDSEGTAPTTAATTPTTAQTTPTTAEGIAPQQATTTVAPTTTPTVRVVANQLPFTGSASEDRAVLGAAALAAGLAFIVGTRRRESLAGR